MNKKQIENSIRGLLSLWVQERNKEIKQQKKVRYAGPCLDAMDYDSLLSALFNDWWSGGKFTLEAEQKLSRLGHRNHSLLCNSGSSANLLLISAAKELYFKDGDKILTLACGFPTTVNPIIQNKLDPYFADINLSDLSVSVDLFKCACKEGIKGAFIPHTLGFYGNINEILDIARKYKVHVFFDCCDAYGTYYNELPIQSFGKAVTYSFYVAHHVTCGEGGGISCNDHNLFHTMRGMRNWGRYCASDDCCIRSMHPESFCPTAKLTKDSLLPDDYMVNYTYEWIGYNLKMLDLQAAMLTSQLDKLEDFNTIRRTNYENLYYNINWEGYNIKVWDLQDGVSPFAFPLILPDNKKYERKHLIDHLRQNNIECRLMFGGNLARHPAYIKKFNFTNENVNLLPNSNKICKDGLMLGVAPVNSESHINNIIANLDDFFEKWK